MRLERIKLLTTFAFVVISCFVFAGSSNAQPSVQKVANGGAIKTMGIITSRSSDSLLMRELSTSNTYFVELSPSTKVETFKKGAFRGGKQYASSYLLRGLRIEIEGTGNADGHVVARSINFDESDLKTAQALEARVDPIEQQAEANRKKIEEDAARIAAAEENAKRMAGQIEEAQAIAANAQAAADRANHRINGLDEFDPVKTIVVPFATGSFTIGPKGKSIIDEAAAWVKTQDTKGWMVAVVGFADSTGNTAKNKTLSEKRANSVIGYLVSKHNLPLTRLVQPFGAGVDKPVATNTTATGRAQNRRVEIRLLVNKGIAGD